MPLLKLPERVLAKLFPSGLAALQGRGDVIRDGGRNLNRRDDGSEEVRELLLTDVRVPAAPVEPGTAVVHVFALLLLGGHRAAASGARQQAHEGVLRRWCMNRN